MDSQEKNEFSATSSNSISDKLPLRENPSDESKTERGTGKRLRIKDTRKVDYNKTAPTNRPYQPVYGQTRQSTPFQRPYQNDGEDETPIRRPYNSGNNSEGRSYNNEQGGYQQRNSYSQGGNYQQRSNYGNNQEGGGYQQRNSYSQGGNYQQRSNYGNNQEGGGYQQRNNYSQGGNYQQRSNYGNNQESGGYQQRSNYSQGGNYQQRSNYGNNQEGGGYQQRSGGYNQRNSGYNQRDNQRSGGYNKPGYSQGGSYQQGARRPGQNNNFRANNRASFQNPIKYKEVLKDPNEPIRLNKFLANAGVCSRREADEFIQAGVIKVNDAVITELGTKITRSDKVTFHEEPVQIESKIYILLNKPKNCITTSDDSQNRQTVMDLVKNACQERIYPVGRLDRNTTGVLLLTNDGEMAAKLTHPSFKKKKIYHVWLDREVSIEDMEKLANGIELEDGEIHADAISYANEEDRSQVGIEIHSGKNRVVRRMFEMLGYHVIRLDRVYFAGLTKKNLGRGKWRYLSEREVNMLRMGSYD
ncbi:MAG: RNA-binding S4 domain-containing protein [Tannerella sp.]|jgi:23S rRNA pseudouridine2605 synthase|nr:RNA-binding S4 domain-containing protein [Tannerella sp.]